MEAALIGAIVTSVIAAVLLIILISICVCYTARSKRQRVKQDTQKFENIPRFEFLSRYGGSSDRDSLQTASEASTDGQLPLHTNRMFIPMPSDIRSLGPYAASPKKQKKIKAEKKMKKNKSKFQSRFPYLDERELARRRALLELTSGSVREETFPQARHVRPTRVLPNTESRDSPGSIRFTPYQVHARTDRHAAQAHAYPIIYHDPQYIQGHRVQRELNGHRDMPIRSSQKPPLDRPSKIQFSPIDLRRSQSFLNRDPNNISIISADSAFHTSLDTSHSPTRAPPSPPYDLSSANSHSIDTHSYPVQDRQRIPSLPTDRVVSRSRPINFRYGRSRDIESDPEMNIIATMEPVEYARVIRPGRAEIVDTATTDHGQGYTNAGYSPMYTRKISMLQPSSSSESSDNSEVAQYFVYQRAPRPSDMVLGNKQNRQHLSPIMDENNADPIYSTVHKVSKQHGISPVTAETRRSVTAGFAQIPLQSSMGNQEREPNAKIYCAKSAYRGERSGRSSSIPLPSPPRTRHVARVVLTDSKSPGTLHSPETLPAMADSHNDDDREIDRYDSKIGENRPKTVHQVNGYPGITPIERIHQRMPVEKSNTAKLKSKKRLSIKLRKTRSFNETPSTAENRSKSHAYSRPDDEKSRDNISEHVTVTSFRRLSDTKLPSTDTALFTSNNSTLRDRNNVITGDIIKTEIHYLSPSDSGMDNSQESTYTELPYLTGREMPNKISAMSGSKSQTLNQASIPPPLIPPPPPPVSSIPSIPALYQGEFSNVDKLGTLY